MAAKLTVNPGGTSTVVTVTKADSAQAVPVFTDASLTNLRLMPATITAATEFWVADDGIYRLSLKQGGVEQYLPATIALATGAPQNVGLPGNWGSSPGQGAGAPIYLPQVGPPTSGQWYQNQLIIDITGAVWQCITPGTPGFWAPASPGSELQSADLSTNFALSSTAIADITGLAITIPVAPSKAFAVELSLPFLSVGAVGQYCIFYISDGAGTVLAEGCTMPGSGGVGLSSATVLRARLPRMNTGAYAITPGNLYGFKAQYAMNSVAGGNGNLSVAAGATRPMLRAVLC